MPKPDMKAQLIVVDSATDLEQIDLDGLPLTIGRSPEAEVTLDDRWVSRRHCVLEWLDEMLVIRDLGSKHGTYVNNELITEVKLQPGDKLAVGMSTFLVTFNGTVVEKTSPIAAHVK